MDPLIAHPSPSAFDPVGLIHELGLQDTAPLVLLDSAGGAKALARYHYLAWRPALWLRVKDGRVRVTSALPRHAPPDDPSTNAPLAPFLAMRAAGAAARSVLAAAPFPEARGLFGLVAYDAARYLERLPDTTRDDLRLPDIDLFLPTRFVRYDTHTGDTVVVCWPLPQVGAPMGWDQGSPEAQGDDGLAADAADQLSAAGQQPTSLAAGPEHDLAAADRDRIVAALEQAPQAPSPEVRGVDLPIYRSNFTRVHYENVVGRTREYVFAGDIFQANLSQRLELRYTLPSLHLYQTLRTVNPSPFAGYLHFGDYELISSSPERLVEMSSDGWAQTRPIAGTRPRGQAAGTAHDAELTQDLNLDPKERAEHVMLVDLERNDLGKVCDYGTVRVSELMVNEYYSHVIHIVSNVRGRLHESRDGVHLLQAMFPGGTITGCPKVRCMEIIDELETVHRAAYTGSFGWLALDALDMNIVIRTLVRCGDRLYLQVGGGIVADSVPEREYFETLHKAHGMLRAVAASIAETPA